ncbi:MAG: hypothetical protein V1772_04465, partial [Chloroflexota bacterium]
MNPLLKLLAALALVVTTLGPLANAADRVTGASRRMTAAATLTFEESVPQPDAVLKQYCTVAAINQGVEFLATARIYQPSQTTSSPSHALTNRFPGQEFGENNTLRVRFTTPQTSVGVKVGLDQAHGFQVTAAIYAYSSDTPGTGYVNYSTAYLGYGPTPITSDLTVTSASANIRSVVIEFTGPSVGNYAHEIVDDLSLSTAGPSCGADTAGPTVQITTPASNGQQSYVPSIVLAFLASDLGTGVAAIQVLFLGSGGATLDSFYVCGGSGSSPCIYDVAPTHASYNFYTLLADGTQTIRVIAWDFGGNTGSADRTLTYIALGPNVNLWAESLEITQGIQPWLATSTVHRSSVTLPPEFTYPAAPTAVPLVADRTTYVRLYGGVEGTAS